jgi:hypothetical protein
MTTYQRRYLCCQAACEAWMNCVSPSSRIVEALSDEGIEATEEDIGLGLDALRYFAYHDMGMDEVGRMMAAATLAE